MVETKPKMHGLAVAALHRYQGKMIEINTGEIQTTLQYSDYDAAQKSLIRGKLVDAYADALILECDIRGEKKEVMISCWSINAMAELDAVGSLSEIYIDEYKFHNKK